VRARYVFRVQRRTLVVTLLKVGLCVQGFLPAYTLWNSLERLDHRFIHDYNFRTLALGLAETGVWAFLFLFCALACTPIARLTGFRWPSELRRTLGLLAFFWVVLHALVYVVIGQKLNWEYVWLDALARKSRIAGWLSLFLLLPLALTSTDFAIRFLGGRRWKNLHRAVYIAAGLAALHLAWVDHDTVGDYSRTQRALIPFLILIAVRFVPLAAIRQKLRSSAPTRSSPDH